MATGTEVTDAATDKAGPDTKDSRTKRPPDVVTFPDLVRAHQAWEEEANARKPDEIRQPGGTLEQEFRQRWRQFERRYGKIETAYWSVRNASAVALSVKTERPQRFRTGHDQRPRFHRATDWATRDEPEIAAALDECETLATKVEEILRGPSELIALRRVNAVASHLLGYVDRAWGREPAPPAGMTTPDWIHQADCRRFVEQQRSELDDIQRFYERTGEGQAKILFFWGMFQGLVALAVFTAVTGLVAWLVDSLDRGEPHWGELQLLAICVMAGALGAFLSVLTRMASTDATKFKIDFEVGRTNVRWLGIYRPFVGGIFGLATFLLLASGILQTQDPPPERDYAYFGIIAFFSGFFERFTKLPTEFEPADESSNTDKNDKTRKTEREAQGP